MVLVVDVGVERILEKVGATESGMVAEPDTGLPVPLLFTALTLKL